VGAESFTILAILEARDRASEIFAKVDESLGKFSDTAKSAADTARAAGDSIDESLLKTASGADALDLAEARVSAAQARVAASTQAQADAERSLLAAQAAAAAGADDDAQAQGRLATASQALTAAQKESALAAKGLSDAQKVQSDTAAAAAAKNDEAAAGQAAVSDASGASALSLAKVGKVAGITGLALGAIAALSVKSAANFQSLTEHLVTDAGESQKNLGMIQSGILGISTATGQSATGVASAMYHVESSGYHAATGLAVLKTVAQGAAVGGSDLDSTSKALVGTLTAYYGGTMTAAQATSRSTSLMNQLIATTAAGDLRMQDLAGSLHSVAAVGASAHLAFSQVGGAIATMTAQGYSADQATQDLAHVIDSLQDPTSVQAQEMRALGLNANSVARNLGKAGLTGTLNTLRDAILSNTSGGTVMLGYLKEMTPAAQGLANQIMAGSISTKALRTAVYGLNPQQAKLISLFEASATSATGLQQTYNAAMSKMTGGQTGLNVALLLTGKHMADFTKATASIQKAADTGGTSVANLSKIQGTLKFKTDQAKTAVENTGTAIGLALTPAVTRFMGIAAGAARTVSGWVSGNRGLTSGLFVAATAIAVLVAAISLAAKTFKAITGAVNSVRSVISGTIGLFKKLGGAAKASAAEQEAASGEAAAAAEADATETAAANEAAAAESSGSWIAAAASTVAGWAVAGAKMVAQGAVWVAQNAVKVASVVASSVTGAATTAGAWVAAGARQAAGAALWVAQGIGKVAVMVAANVAGAATTAAAWVVANAVMLLGIGLIIAAVIAAVVLIVKNWGKISAAAKAAFHDVLAVVDSTIAWVKSHWPLLLAILLGPIAVAALMIKEHFGDIKNGAMDVVHFIEDSFKRLLQLDSTLRSAGIKLVMGLVHGIESVAMAPVHAVESIVSSVRSLLPFSPAKKGPLSGGGSPDIAGAKFSTMFAGGITSAAGTAASAAHQLAAGVSRQLTAGALGHGGTPGIASSLAASAVGPASGSGGGNVQITVDMRGAHLMTDADMQKFLNKLGPVLNRTLAQAGHKLNLR